MEISVYFWTVVFVLIHTGSCNMDECPLVVRESKHFISTLKGMCYMFVGEEKYWDSARNYCWQLGGEMVVVENKDTMEHLKTVLRSRRVRWSSKGVWIGARFYGTSRGWRWTTGQPVRYNNWADGQPSRILGLISFEDCALMRRGDDWKWHDYPCSALKYHYNFICQFRKERVPVNIVHTYHEGKAKSIVIPGGEHEAHTSSSGSIDNGNTLILGIIIGMGAFMILTVIIVFFIYRDSQKRKYERDIPAAHYGQPYSEVNRSESPPPYHARAQPASDIYLTPAEMNSIYEEVNKPADTNNQNNVLSTRPLLNSNASPRQTAEGASVDASASIDGAHGGLPPLDSDRPPLPDPPGIPAIMETSVRSVNEYVEMNAGASTSAGASVANSTPASIKQETVNLKEIKITDSKSNSSKEAPIYSNVDTLKNTNATLYEDLP